MQALLKLKLYLSSQILASLLIVSSAQKELRTWTYELVELKYETSDEKLLKPDIHVRQLGRNDFVIDGTILFNADFDEQTIIDVKALRNPHGPSDYVLLPFQIPKQNIFEFFNTIYKTTLMESLQNCSNMPYSHEAFVPPFEKKLYTFENCRIEPSGYPKYLPAGFYQMIFNGYDRKVNWTSYVVTKVENDEA